MSSNSSMGASASGAFGLAQPGGGLVQHRVDVLVALLGAEALGELHRLVQHHPPGNVETLLELVGAEQEDAAFDGIELRRGPVEVRGESRFQLRAPGDDAFEQLLEVLDVGV